jgi:hypothetical protein
MSRKKQKPVEDAAFVLFDVLYDDGMRTSNRRVPSSELMDWDLDASARKFIEAQDDDIRERSGKARGAIKSITRSTVR